MNNIKIDFCKDLGELRKVHQLSDMNKKTLGFMSYEAFNMPFYNKRIICASDSKNNLLGYILFYTAKNRVKIVHFCVDKKYRKTGVAKKIFSFLVQNTENGLLNGVSLYCRRDYGLEGFWQSLGFYALGEKRGRAKKSTSLTQWFKAYHQEDLLLDMLKPDENKITVVLDTCILIDLYKENKNVSLLLADWLTDDLEYMITQEAYNDIDNCTDQDERKKTKQYLTTYKQLEDKTFEKDCYAKQLEAIFPSDNLSSNTKLDIGHISITASHNIKFFVTSDKALLNKREQIYEITNLKVLNPMELIDELYNNKIDYNPKKLHSLNLQKRIVPLTEVKSLFQDFLAKGESLLSVYEQISNLSKEPHDVKRVVVSIEDKNHLFAVKVLSEKEISLKFLRTSKFITLSDSLLYEFIATTIDSLCEFDNSSIVIEDKVCISRYYDLLVNLGFVMNKEGFMKKYAINSSLCLEDSLKVFSRDNEDSMLAEMFNSSLSNRNINSDDYLERFCYPLVLKDSDINYYLIPIKYNWAMELFQKNYAKADCIGVTNHNLIISRENVYYSAKNMKSIELPARILWYTSNQKGGFASKEISALSKIDSFERGLASHLFKKNEKYGVFKWDDINDLSKFDTRELLVIKFFDTFLLPKAIKLEELYSLGITAPQSICKLNIGNNKIKLLERIHER